MVSSTTAGVLLLGKQSLYSPTCAGRRTTSNAWAILAFAVCGLYLTRFDIVQRSLSLLDKRAVWESDIALQERRQLELRAIRAQIRRKA
jgi:hypothetical protein